MTHYRIRRVPVTRTLAPETLNQNLLNCDPHHTADSGNFSYWGSGRSWSCRGSMDGVDGLRLWSLLERLIWVGVQGLWAPGGG